MLLYVKKYIKYNNILIKCMLYLEKDNGKF